VRGSAFDAGGRQEGADDVELLARAVEENDERLAGMSAAIGNAGGSRPPCRDRATGDGGVAFVADVQREGE
jgi:hypothetical protein